MAVTNVHIQNGSKHSSGCPIVLALEENGYPKCRVKQDGIMIFGSAISEEGNPVTKFESDIEITNWISRHDSGEEVQPFNLHLDFTTNRAMMHDESKGA